MSNFINEIADEVKDTILRAVLPTVRRELAAAAKDSFVFCFSEEEAAEKLKISAQTLARRRKGGEIDYSTSPAGKPVYMTHHLLDFLKRREIRHGKQAVTLDDVLNKNVVEFPARKAA